MNKYISYYYLQDRLGSWPDIILTTFDKNFSKYGGPWFYQGTSDEAEFEQHCASLNVEYYKGTLLKVTGKSLFEYPFHYLTVANDRYVYSESDFLDFSNICDEKDFFCGQGIKQYNKITIDYKNSKLLDIMETPTRLSLLVVSRKMKDFIESNGLTGCTFTPCAEKGKSYAKQDLLFDAYSKEIEKNAQFFQLTVTERVINPPNIGSLRRFFSQCPQCKRASGFDSDQTAYFSRNDLKYTDFQWYSEYATSEGNIFEIPGKIYIISSRTLKLFKNNKVKGMIRYLTDPPIQHGVVEIK